MDRSEFILKTIQATFVGLITLIVLLAIGRFLLEPIIDLLYPPLPPCPPVSAETTDHSPDYPCYSGGGMLDFGQNFDKYLYGLFTLYFVSICVAGFISGFYVNISRLWAESDNSAAYIWQSLISGLVIGIIVPLFISIIRNRPTFIGDIFIAFVLVIPAMMSGFIGYKFHIYKRDLISTPKNLITNLGLPSLIGLIIFVVLRALFTSIIDAKCEYFPTQGILLSACTESWIAFGMILSVAAFMAGWWIVRINNQLEYSVISGLLVGILGPLLGIYLFSQTTSTLVYFFYGMWGGLFGLCGGVSKRKIRYLWRFSSSNWTIAGLVGRLARP